MAGFPRPRNSANPPDPETLWRSRLSRLDVARMESDCDRGLFIERTPEGVPWVPANRVVLPPSYHARSELPYAKGLGRALRPDEVYILPFHPMMKEDDNLLAYWKENGLDTSKIFWGWVENEKKGLCPRMPPEKTSAERRAEEGIREIARAFNEEEAVRAAAEAASAELGARSAELKESDSSTPRSALSAPRSEDDWEDDFDEEDFEEEEESVGARPPCERHEESSICSCEAVLPGEGEEKFRAATEEAKRKMRPRGMAEEILVESVVLARWRLKRFLRAESFIWSRPADDEAAKRFSQIERMRAAAQRELFRALRELRMLQKERRGRKEQKQRERKLTAERVRRHREKKRREADVTPKRALHNDHLTLTKEKKIETCNAVFEKIENAPETAESGENATSAVGAGSPRPDKEGAGTAPLPLGGMRNTAPSDSAAPASNPQSAIPNPQSDAPRSKVSRSKKEAA